MPYKPLDSSYSAGTPLKEPSLVGALLPVSKINSVTLPSTVHGRKPTPGCISASSSPSFMNTWLNNPTPWPSLVSSFLLPNLTPHNLLKGKGLENQDLSRFTFLFCELRLSQDPSTGAPHWPMKYLFQTSNKSLIAFWLRKTDRTSRTIKISLSYPKSSMWSAHQPFKTLL